jgi:hypothetical protein
MGLEGIVSKRLDRAYGAGKCKHWVKVKNPAHPAYFKARDAFIRARQSYLLPENFVCYRRSPFVRGESY